MEPDTTPPSEELDVYEQEQFEDWLKVGIEAKWISVPDCTTHNGFPMRDWEEDQFEQGYDPCIVATRIWRDGYQHLTMADFKDVESD